MHLPDATAELPPSARCSQRNTLAPAVLKAGLRPSKLERQNDAKRGSGHRDDIRLLFVRQRFFLSRQGDASRACHPDRLKGRRRKGKWCRVQYEEFRIRETQHETTRTYFETSAR